MARVSTSNNFDASVQQLQQRQADLADAQLRLTSGKRVMRASDDPVGAARAERALASISRIDATKRSVETSRVAMSQTESALADANELLHQARESLVAAGNGSYSDGERAALANRLRQVREQLLSVANRGDGADGFLFGGQGSAHPPFVDQPGGVVFAGTGGRINTVGDEPLPLTIDGAATWLAARTGNGVFETRVLASTGSAVIDAGTVTDPAALTGSTYEIRFAVAGGVTTYSVLRDGAATAIAGAPFTPGMSIAVDGMSTKVTGAPADGDAFELRPSTSTLSVFDTLDKAIADLTTPGLSNAQRAQTAAQNLSNIDSVMGRLQDARAFVGEVLNRIDGATSRLDTLKLGSETETSNAEDLDMLHAISEFQSRQSGYDAALKAYSMVQRMSLFQYLQV